MNFIIFENNSIKKFLSIIFINVVIFQNLLNSRKRKNNYKVFLFFIKKIIEILKSFETIRNNISKNLKIHIVIEIILIILKQKFFKFFHKFKIIFNFKKIENLLFYRVYNYKIEFINDVFTFFKNKIYFLLFKKLETLQKYFKKIF